MFETYHYPKRKYAMTCLAYVHGRLVFEVINPLYKR